MQTLTAYVTKGHRKDGIDDFSDWYYVVLFCRHKLRFDFLLQKTKTVPIKDHAQMPCITHAFR